MLLDVRQPWEYQIGRIPGATLVPMAEIPRRAGGFEKSKPVVVYCHHGIRSAQVAHYLERLGFADVANLEGGIEAYSREADDRIPRY
jgi:rhodanese-related sulfurtransferase